MSLMNSSIEDSSVFTSTYIVSAYTSGYEKGR